MDFAYYDVIGSIGVAFVVGSYFLVQIGRLSTDQGRYSIMNGLGALLILFSLYFEFNMSAFLIEAFWVLISVIGLVRYYRRKRAETDSLAE